MTPALRTDAALLVLRLVIGVTFLVHGLDKLGDVNGVEQFFDGLGIPTPAVMAPLVAITETVGGILLIVGLLTPLAGVALTIDMIVAALTVHVENGFFVAEGGYELVFLLAAGCVAVIIAGAGRFSLDALMLRGGRRPAWLRAIVQQ